MITFLYLPIHRLAKENSAFKAISWLIGSIRDLTWRIRNRNRFRDIDGDQTSLAIKRIEKMKSSRRRPKEKIRVDPYRAV